MALKEVAAQGGAYPALLSSGGLDAMMTYAVTGKKAKLEKPVAQWHFRLFCEMLDDDRCTVPSHTLLVRLWKKVGLLKGLNDEN